MTVADSLFEYLLGVFPPGRPYTRAQFERSPMSPLVAHYLAQALQYRLDAELEQLHAASSDWFEVNHPEVEEAYQAFAAVLTSHARIPADEWQPALRRAVDQVVDFLVRPAQTLTDHVFEDHDGPLPAAVVHRRLGFFAAYPYLRDVIEAYFEQRNLEQIDRSRFTALLARIDRQMTEDHTVADWLRMLDPLFELAGTPLAASGAVPVTLLRAFFAEKGATEVQRRLQQAQERQGLEAVGRDDLRRLLEPPTPVLQEPARPAPAPAPRPAPTATPAPEPTEPARPTRPRTPTGEEGPVPLWKKFQHGDYTPEDRPQPRREPQPEPRSEPPREPHREPHREQRPEPPSRPAPPPPPPPVAASRTPTPSEPLPLWKRFQARPDAPPAPTADEPAGLGALERLVLGERGQRNRDLFIKHLFSGSSEAYEQTLRLLHKAPNWTRASHIIAQEIFLRHQVNIYSEPAVAFTDAVEARFRG